MERISAEFTVDSTDPVVNDRPHYTNALGEHLYHCSGEWHVSNTLNRSGANGFARFSTTGSAVPLGDSTWRAYDYTARRFVDRKLTVTAVDEAPSHALSLEVSSSSQKPLDCFTRQLAKNASPVRRNHTCQACVLPARERAAWTEIDH